MEAVVMKEPGGPEVLSWGSTEKVSPKAGEVLLQVAAAGVNRPDVFQRYGFYPAPPGASEILGLEVSGTVIAQGEGVTTPAIGEAVCALVPGGGYATQCVAPASLCLPIPAPVSLVEAAGLPETFFTVWWNVFMTAGLQAGDRFLVHGGSSGIGTTAIQLAKAFGAEVFTTAGSAEKCALCRDLGADLAVNYKEEDFVEALKGHLGKARLDIILDMVGGPYLAKNIALMARGGRHLSIAFLQGSKAEVDFMPVMLKQLTLTGATLRPQPLETKTAIAGELKAKVWPLLEAGSIKPVTDTVFPAQEAAKAHALMEASNHKGKILLEMPATA